MAIRFYLFTVPTEFSVGASPYSSLGAEFCDFSLFPPTGQLMSKFLLLCQLSLANERQPWADDCLQLSLCHLQRSSGVNGS